MGAPDFRGYRSIRFGLLPPSHPTLHYMLCLQADFAVEVSNGTQHCLTPVFDGPDQPLPGANPDWRLVVLPW